MATIKYRLGSTLDVDQTLSWGSKITKKDINKPNSLTFSIRQSSTPQLNDEVLYYDSSNTQVFGGYIQNISDSPGVQNIEVMDYSIKLSQEKFSAIYESMSPEAIIEDIIDNYTDLTYVSTVSTGITITKIVFQDEWIIDGINKMLEIFKGSYNVDLSKNFNMSIESTSYCTESIIYGIDYLDGGWSTDIQKKAEKVVVIGAVIDQRTTETLSGTGTVFYTSYKPENVEIAGFQQTTSDIDGDYEVDIQNKKITFESSQTDPEVNYTYKSQIRVELGTGKTVTLEKKYIETKSEARKLAIQYKNKFEDGSQSSKWIKSSSNIGNFNVGDMIPVTDERNNKTGFYKISKVTFELPKKMFLEIGEDEDDLFDWQKETIERVKQLEKNNSNSDFITLYDYLKENISIAIGMTVTELIGIENTGKILWASDTTLATNADLISDTGVDDDYALAYDDYYMPVQFLTDFLNLDRWPELTIESGASSLTTEGGDIFVR